MNHSLGIEFSTVSIRGTQNYNQVVFAILVNNTFDTLLTLRVKCTGGGSDKALSLDQQWFSPRTFHTGSNGWALYSITLANNNDLFPL